MVFLTKMSPEVREWTNEQVIRLIDSYKEKAMLWDPNHDLYRIQTAKYEAWSELAVEFGCEIVDLRKKFNSIFASHRREKAKVRHGGKSTWFLYHHLTFLPGHMDYNQGDNESRAQDSETKTQKRSKSPVDEEKAEYLEERFMETSSELEDYDDNGSNSPVHILVKEEEPEVIVPQTAKYFKSKPVQKRRIIENKLRDLRRKKKFMQSKIVKKNKLQYAEKGECESFDKIYENNYQRDNNYSKGYKNKDECDSFGEYIAVSLRKYDEKTRSMIKQAINNILFEQEMKKYNAGNYTVIYTAVDENPLIVPDECEK